MKHNDTVYTSICICEDKSSKLKACTEKLGVSETQLLSILCYKAGMFICKEARCFKTIEYQKRDKTYKIKPVRFFASDHEYMHSHRLACKVSVSLLISFAIDLFLDEIMKKGINPIEIAHLRALQNSYKQKSYNLRNFSFKITNNCQFEEYSMKIRMGKT